MHDAVTVAHAIDLYKDIYLAARNLAVRSRREYLSDLRQLGEYLEAVDVRTVQGVQRTHLEGFLASLDGLTLANSTRRRKLAAVRSFFQFLQDSDYRTG